MAQDRARFAFVLVLFTSLAIGTLGCSESHGLLGNADGGPTLRDATPAVDVGTASDAGHTGHDAFVATDGGVMPSSCAPQDAHEMVCPVAVCDGLDSYAWDGERCVRIDCGTCVGADCLHLVLSQAVCEASHAMCEPEMCRASGGDWLFWPVSCGNYVCGRPPPSDCIVAMPACDCGNGRSFDAARGGCVDDPHCPAIDPLPPQTLCSSTGGSWMRGICCPTRCGEFCPAACVADACACGPLQIFDPVRGCIDAAACHVHTTGQECNETGVRCQDGMICCQHCGGAGCDPLRTCQAPVCDSDPHIDMCGNNLLAP